MEPGVAHKVLWQVVQRLQFARPPPRVVLDTLRACAEERTKARLTVTAGLTLVA